MKTNKIKIDVLEPVKRNELLRKSMIYTLTNVSAALGIQPSQLSYIRLMDKAIVAVGAVGNKRFSRFVSYKKVTQAFVNKRKEGAKKVALSVTSDLSFGGKTHLSALAIASDKTTRYGVNIDAHRTSCQCEDMKRQKEMLGSKRGCCKHVYALLNTYGYGSYQELVNEYNRTITKPVTTPMVKLK